MSATLIINADSYETRVAVVENGQPAEFYIERSSDRGIAGNIYKGRVVRVLPGMQAAFVDIGMEKAAFLYVSDVHPYSGDLELLFRISEESAAEEGDEPEDNPATVEASEEYPGAAENKETAENREAEETKEAGDNRETSRGYRNHTDFPIEQRLEEGQEILAQVAKEPLGNKGARITTHVTLPGRLLVLMPTMDHVGVSRRIEVEEERKRLRDVVTSIKSSHFGYIVRTAAEGAEAARLKAEMEFLLKLWQNLQRRAEHASVPSLVYQDLDITLRAVRDLFTKEVDLLVIDSETEYRKILSFADTFMPSLKDSVQLYDKSEPIFDAYGIEMEVQRALGRKVWLKSGGYIIIETTEALTAIDVNTGRYVGKHNLEETILKTNLEAVKEIAYQLRLRNIGGIIIIDFIDMEKESNRDKVFNAMREAVRKDKSKTNILRMSELGLIEMTRKRTKESIGRLLCEPCFYCVGEGYLKSKQTICYEIIRELEREQDELFGHDVLVMVHPDVATWFYDEERIALERVEERLHARIMVKEAASFHLEQYEIALL